MVKILKIIEKCIAKCIVKLINSILSHNMIIVKYINIF